jgi:hypothetical protein
MQLDREKGKPFFSHFHDGDVFSLGKKDIYFGFFVILLSSALIAFLGVNRNFFTYGVETDYLARFIINAQKLLNGEPIKLIYHPPFYQITLALIQPIINNWFVTGLIISLISAVLVLITNYVFYYQLFGPHAARGSLIVLVSSGSFISYSAQASSEMFFLALYCCCFFFSLQAIISNSNKYWVITGLIMGFALLTRSNSLTLIILIASPWFQSSRLPSRFKNFLWLIIGCSIPLLAWAVFTSLTGSQGKPSEAHLNLALRYFAPDALRAKGAGDAMPVLREKFQNTYHVIAYNPIHIVKTYIKDLAILNWRTLSHNKLIVFPLNLFVLPGIILLFFHTRKFFVFLFIVATLLQIAIVNFSPYNIRKYLFLIPVFGAGVGLCFKKIFEEKTYQWRKYIILVLLLFLTGVGIVKSAPEIHEILHSQDKEFEEAIPELKKWLSHMSVVVVRKPHIPYYVNCQWIMIPPVESTDQLKEALQAEFRGYPIYFYYGSVEQWSRPGLIDLKFPVKSPEWLEPIAKSRTPGSWVLYRFLSSS